MQHLIDPATLNGLALVVVVAILAGTLEIAYARLGARRVAAVVSIAGSSTFAILVVGVAVTVQLIA